MMYQIAYLPAARQDLIEIASYISHKLQNPRAAESLALHIINAMDHLSSFPYANPVYTPIRPLRHEYRRLIVKNYIVLYWIDEKSKTITIASVVYYRRDYSDFIKQT
ncbi:addiction module toxin%2C RelE/StbE family [uncultured Eubacterium sp.]|nr:addiction module toxin%2C RelE/StbE family [uncultured Eubacterium sp.]